MQQQLAPLDGEAQILRELELFQRLSTHGVFEEAVAAATLRFGLVHGKVGVGEQLMMILHGALAHGDAYACGKVYDVTADLERLLYALNDCLRQVPEALCLGVYGQNNEFVSPQASDEVGRAEAFPDAISDPHKDVISGIVAIGVVDRFEAVEVDEEGGKLVLFSCVDELLNPSLERDSIRKFRQGVVQRKVGELLIRAGKRVGQFGGAGFKTDVEGRCEERNAEDTNGPDDDQNGEPGSLTPDEAERHTACLGKRAAAIPV